jgi:acyl-coenzyme A synthetase/AMP-(fatty) acid ligase
VIFRNKDGVTDPSVGQFLGVIAAGGVYAGTNPAYTSHELAHALRTSKARFVLSQADLMAPVLKAAGEVGLEREKVVLFNPDGEGKGVFEGQLQWRDLLSHGETDWVRFDDLETARNTTAALLFSSGTTGLPKAAMLSHYNFVAQHTLVYEAPPRPYRVVRLTALPMFHAASAPVAHTTPLRIGQKNYVLPRFDLEKWFWAHEKYGVTDVAMVPPVSALASRLTFLLRSRWWLTLRALGGHHGDQQPAQRQVQHDSSEGRASWSGTSGQAPASARARDVGRRACHAGLGDDGDVLYCDSAALPDARHDWECWCPTAQFGYQAG